VTWNSEAGHVSGRIIRVHTKDVDYKGHTHHASEDDPRTAHHSRREWRFALGCGVSAAPPVQTEADFLPPQPVFRYTVDSDGAARGGRDTGRREGCPVGSSSIHP